MSDTAAASTRDLIGHENIFNVLYEEYRNPLAGTITDYTAAKVFEEDKWSDAVNHCWQAGCTSGAEWKEFYTAGEEEQVAKREELGEFIARTKQGKIIATKAFPKTWNVDKSVIGKALDSGVSIVDSDGKPKPKSALQDEYKATEAPKVERTDIEKARVVYDTLCKLYVKLDAEEQEEVRSWLVAFEE